MAILYALLLVSLLSTAAAQSPYDEVVAQIKQGNFTTAIPTLERLVAQSPLDLRSRNLLGIALSGTGRREDANRHFLEILKANPAYLPALKNLAANELELGNQGEARRHFEQALSAAPKDPAVHLGLAQIEFAAKNYHSAISHYEQSGSLYMQDTRALINYATSCMEWKQPANALSALQQLPARTDPDTHFAVGLLLARLDQFEGAAQHFEQARNGSVALDQVEYNLTLAYLKSKNYSAAIEVAKAASPTTEIYSLLSQAYEASSRTKEAYEALSSATLLNPRDEAPYLELIALCVGHENYELSLEIANVGVRSIPASHRLRIQRGVVYAMRGQLGEAEKDFESAVELGPQSTLGLIAKSLVLMQTNRVSTAVDDLRRRNRQDGGDYLVNWFLAEALTRQGGESESEAITALETSVRLNPNVSQPRILLGKLLLARGDTERAIHELEKALELDPESIPATYQLAQACRKKGDSRRAGELFAKVGKFKAETSSDLTNSGLLRIVRESTH